MQGQIVRMLLLGAFVLLFGLGMAVYEANMAS